MLLSVLSSKRRTFVKYVISSTADYLLTMPPATREKATSFYFTFLCHECLFHGGERKKGRRKKCVREKWGNQYESGVPGEIWFRKYWRLCFLENISAKGRKKKKIFEIAYREEMKKHICRMIEKSLWLFGGQIVSEKWECNFVLAFATVYCFYFLSSIFVCCTPPPSSKLIFRLYAFGACVCMSRTTRSWKKRQCRKIVKIFDILRGCVKLSESWYHTSNVEFRIL